VAKKKGRVPAAPRPLAPPRPISLTAAGKLPPGYSNEMRSVFDRALAAGQGLLDNDSTSPTWRSYIERDMAIVRKARDGDLLIDVQLSQGLPEIINACMNLAAFGPAPRIEEGAVKLAMPRIEAETKQVIVQAANAGRRRASAPAIEARYKWIEDTCRDNGRSIHESSITGWLVDMKGRPKTAKEISRLTRQIDRDLCDLRDLKKS
jgi:hypothetical protein